jgi:hypothetical protein
VDASFVLRSFLNSLIIFPKAIVYGELTRKGEFLVEQDLNTRKVALSKGRIGEMSSRWR